MESLLLVRSTAARAAQAPPRAKHCRASQLAQQSCPHTGTAASPPPHPCCSYLLLLRVVAGLLGSLCQQLLVLLVPPVLAHSLLVHPGPLRLVAEELNMVFTGTWRGQTPVSSFLSTTWPLELMPSSSTSLKPCSWKC